MLRSSGVQLCSPFDLWFPSESLWVGRTLPYCHKSPSCSLSSPPLVWPCVSSPGLRMVGFQSNPAAIITLTFESFSWRRVWMTTVPRTHLVATGNCHTDVIEWLNQMFLLQSLLSSNELPDASVCLGKCKVVLNRLRNVLGDFYPLVLLQNSSCFFLSDLVDRWSPEVLQELHPTSKHSVWLRDKNSVKK